jgi:hypothetical protein
VGELTFGNGAGIFEAVAFCRENMVSVSQPVWIYCVSTSQPVCGECLITCVCILPHNLYVHTSQPVCTYGHSHTLSHTLAHSHTPSHTLTHSHTLSHTHTHSQTLYILLVRGIVEAVAFCRENMVSVSQPVHPRGNPGANLKSISHRCYLILVAFVCEVTSETIHLLLSCLQSGCGDR